MLFFLVYYVGDYDYVQYTEHFEHFEEIEDVDADAEDFEDFEDFDSMVLCLMKIVIQEFYALD